MGFLAGPSNTCTIHINELHICFPTEISTYIVRKYNGDSHDILDCQDPPGARTPGEGDDSIRNSHQSSTVRMSRPPSLVQCSRVSSIPPSCESEVVSCPSSGFWASTLFWHVIR